MKLFRASAHTVATGLGAQLFLLISGPLVARLLGVVDRGYLAGLIAWPVFIVSLGSIGIGSACTYYLSREPRDAPRILGEVYRITLLQVAVLTAVVLAVLVAWTRGKPDAVRLAAYPMVVMVPAWLFHQYALSALQGLGRVTRFNVLRILPVGLYAVGAIALFVLGVNTIIAVVAISVGSFAVSAVAATLSLLSIVRPTWVDHSPLRQQLISFGMRGHLGGLSAVESLKLDHILGTLLLSAGDLGLYAVAGAFCNLPRIIAEGAGKFLYPMIVHQRGRRSQSRLLWKAFGGVTALNVVFSTILFIAMPFLIGLLFGEQFASATPVARILLLGTTLVASRRILADGLRGLGKPGMSTLTEISMYPWLLVGAPLLVYSMGVVGLALTLTIAYGLSLLVAIGVVLRLTRFRGGTSQIKPDIAEGGSAQRG